MEATKGALWDAYAEVAIYMEILHVRASTRGPGLATGENSSFLSCPSPVSEPNADVMC